jgi:hypothetical protein
MLAVRPGWQPEQPGSVAGDLAMTYRIWEEERVGDGSAVRLGQTAEGTLRIRVHTSVIHTLLLEATGVRTAPINLDRSHPSNHKGRRGEETPLTLQIYQNGFYAKADKTRPAQRSMARRRVATRRKDKVEIS